MSTITKIAPVSSFARFVQGDIKGGEHAHAYRKEVIANAIEQAFKGNYSPITEAQSLTEGKAKKARAYAAGFAALGPIGSTNADGVGVVKVAYKGALNAHENKVARDEIAAKTAASMCAFFVAFDAVMAEKAAPKSPKAPSAPKDASTDDADQQRHAAAVALDDSVTSMEAMLRTGALTGEQSDRIVDALIAGLNSEQLVALTVAVSAEMDKRIEAATPVLPSVPAETAHA